MHSTSALVHPRAIPHYGRDGRPVWYSVEASDDTRLDIKAGLSVTVGRLDTEDGTPGQLMVHINTEGVGEDDTYGEGMPKIVVSLNDGEIYDDRGRGNVADPIDGVVFVVDTTEGPVVFTCAEQAKEYAEFWGHAWWSEGYDVLDRQAGAAFVRDSTEDEQAAA